MRSRQIDDIPAPWGQRQPEETERVALPMHPWMGRIPLYAGGTEVVVGAPWMVCADLLAEVDDRRPIVSLRGLRSLLTFLGSPIDADDVGTLEGFWRPLVLITAGTVVTVVKVAGSVMWDYGGVVTSNIRFALPDGRTFILTTAASYGELAAQDAIRAGKSPDPIVGLSWADIACAAMIVPVDHPVATDVGVRDALLARIERLANGLGPEPEKEHFAPDTSPLRLWDAGPP